MTWRIDGSSCSPDDCEQNGFTVYQNGNDFQINATLEIMIDLFHAEIVYTVQCIVAQNLEFRHFLVATVNLTVTLEQDVTELSKD